MAEFPAKLADACFGVVVDGGHESNLPADSKSESNPVQASEQQESRQSGSGDNPDYINTVTDQGNQ